MRFCILLIICRIAPPVIDDTISIKKNDILNSDTILSLIQRAEFELLHPDVQKDMRRLEYEYFIVSKKWSKKRVRNEQLIQELNIPSSSSYYSSKHPKCNRTFSFKSITQNSIDPSKLTSRQQLLRWAYNHGDLWAKTFSASRSSKHLPSNLHIKDSAIQTKEKELCKAFLSLLTRHACLRTG